jgi:hypothetical protein
MPGINGSNGHAGFSGIHSLLNIYGHLKGWIPLNDLTPLLCCACPKSGHGLST